MHDFDIYFSAEIVPGRNPAEVKTNIGRIFKLSDDKLDTLFSGKPVRIKSGLKAEEAGKYRKVFLKAGGLINIVPAAATPTVPEESATPQSESKPAADSSDAMQLLPANTGSLIDTAEPTAKFDLSRPDHFGLSPAGALLPDSSDTASFHWDELTELEILPANTGSLEEFEQSREPAVIPDVSQLHTVENGYLSDDVEQAEPVQIPSIDHLQAALPNTGTLEDCGEEQVPVKIPDISKLKLAD